MPAHDPQGTRGLLIDLFLLMKTIGTHGADHPLTAKGANLLAESLKKAEPPVELHFVGRAVFRDRALVPLDLDEYPKVLELTAAAVGMGATELIIDAPPKVIDLIRLGDLLAAGAKGIPAPGSAKIPGMTWRDLPAARWGRDAEDVDPEVFCATHLALAIARTEELVAHNRGPWSWSHGMAVVRRLENAVERSADGLARALEVAPGEWSPARRAVSAAYRLLSATVALGVQKQAARAAAHALLGLACHGLAPIGGVATVKAAAAALPRMMPAPSGGKAGAPTAAGKGSRVAPHRLKVCALLHEIAHTSRDPREWEGLPALIHLVYDLEKGRIPGNVDFALTYADLLAQAAAKMGDGFDERSVRTLVYASGEIPLGAHVTLADGHAGIVIEHGGDPLRPKVLVGTQLVVPDRPVALRLPAPRATRTGTRFGA